jgi:8-oxo-dGTP pyrophosphatase MutT (NUDIX family)
VKTENSFETIRQFARAYTYPPERVRVGCRGLVVKDNKVLVSYEERTGFYMSPGGGLEEGETLEECVARELQEETGFKVKPLKAFLKVKEYAYEVLWENNYFICEIEGECERNLTESEKYNKVAAKWVEIDKAIEIFGNYQAYPTDKASLYLREYTVLKRLKDKI